MNWDIVGHPWAVAGLQHSLAEGTLRHAYLFTGPAHVGKRTLATRLAQAILCSGPAAEAPCGRCRNCLLSAKGIHPDWFTIAPTVSGKRLRSEKIKIEPIRQLIYDLALKPIEAQRRVALLLRFEAANAEGMNALLKTLEEPPANVTVLLTATQADDLLPTIVSRCEVIQLHSASAVDIQEALITRWQVDTEQAQLLAALSGGRLGWAVRMHADPDALDERARLLDDLQRLATGSRVQRFAYVEKWARSAGLDTIQETLELWLSFWRDVLLTAAGAQVALSNPDRQPRIRQWATQLSLRQAQQILSTLHRTSQILDQNVNPRLALEVMLLDWPRLAAD